MTPRWIAIVDLARCEATGHDPVDAADAAIRGGAPRVLVRGRDATARRLLTVVDAVCARVPASQVLVTGRADVCVARGLAGVQLPAAGLPVAVARTVCGPAAEIGASVHDRAELDRARRASWAIVSPIWPTASKPGHPGIGLDGLSTLARAASVPILALGGVTPERVPALVAAGAWGCAALTPFCEGAAASERAARSFAKAFERL